MTDRVKNANPLFIEEPVDERLGLENILIDIRGNGIPSKMPRAMKVNYMNYKNNEKKCHAFFKKAFHTDIKNCNKDILNQIQTLTDEYNLVMKHLLKEKMRTDMKEKYDIDIKDSCYQMPSEEFIIRYKRYAEAMNKEWETLVRFNRKRKSMQKKIKKKLRQKRKPKKEGEYHEEPDNTKSAQHISILLDELDEKEEKCRVALGILTQKLDSSKESIQCETVQRMTQEAIQYKNNVMSMISDGKKSLAQLIKGRRKKKTSGGSNYIDEECSGCMEKEEEWNRYRWTTRLDTDSLTAEDARDFHKHLVRSGGMQSLVDHFRNMLDARVPKNMAFPTFVSSMAHPQTSQELYKILSYYHYFKIIMEEMMNKAEQEFTKDEFKYEIVTNTDENLDEKCFMCQNLCEKH